jgi:hypothetical protein
MSYQPSQSYQPSGSYQPSHAYRTSQAALLFSRDEWESMVTLPRRVLLAAGAAEPDHANRTVAEGLAGIEAIAAGLASSSQLVREVVASIYAESWHRATDEHGDGELGILQTLAACRYASEVLAQRCEPADAQAYRNWLYQIAAAVTGAARDPQPVVAPSATPGLEPGAHEGATVPSGPRQAVVEDRFLYALGGVLRP